MGEFQLRFTNIVTGAYVKIIPIKLHFCTLLPFAFSLLLYPNGKNITRIDQIKNKEKEKLELVLVDLAVANKL